MPLLSFTRRRFVQRSAVLGVTAALNCGSKKPARPNLVFILTDDQRWDAFGASGNPQIVTPAMDSLARRGVRFRNAFVTTSICSPSRACCLTGRYGSLNGVSTVPGNGLAPGETTFVDVLKEAGYRTGYVGKWHLTRPSTPLDAGFDDASWCWSNGPDYERKVFEQGTAMTAHGHIEDYISDRAINFLRSTGKGQPFLLHYSSQLPHMDNNFAWPAKPASLALYEGKQFAVPESWEDTLEGKPSYLKNSRFILQARKYGYDDPLAVRKHIREYSAAVTDADRALGRTLAALDELGLRENTYIVFTGDNGWFLGEHRFTSKVLPYEESIRVPMIVCGPGIQPQVRDEIVLNTDVAPTLLGYAGLRMPGKINGRSLGPLVAREPVPWRTSFYYEALSPSLGTQPLVAVRNNDWKYIQTFDAKDPERLVFEETYNLARDPAEMHNQAGQAPVQDQLKAELERLREAVAREQVV